MNEEHVYVELDQSIISKLHKFKGMVKNNGMEPSDKVSEGLKNIISTKSPTMKKHHVGPVNTFKGCFIKVTRHWAMVGDRTEIGLIYQDSVSSGTGRHHVDYIVVEEETNQYVGTNDDYILKENGQWIMSVDRDNLGDVSEKVIRKW